MVNSKILIAHPEHVQIRVKNVDHNSHSVIAPLARLSNSYVLCSLGYLVA